MSNLTLLPGNGQKSPPIVHILEKDVQLVEYKGKPVVTLRMVDELHRKDNNATRMSFNKHREHFIKKEDFFKVPYDEYSKFLIVTNTNDQGGLIGSNGHDKSNKTESSADIIGTYRIKTSSLTSMMKESRHASK